MKKFILCLALGAFLFSCNNEKDKPAATEKTPVDLPYTASYSSSWSTDVSDADLKTVLTIYKDWADGNMSGLEKALADTIAVDGSSGDHIVKPKADMIKIWGIYRDSLSSIKIDMQGWHKMYSTDKKDGFIVTWYKEYDTYKNGKVDSASYHDINQVKDGKLIWYSSYKRPLK